MIGLIKENHLIMLESSRYTIRAANKRAKSFSPRKRFEIVNIPIEKEDISRGRGLCLFNLFHFNSKIQFVNSENVIHFEFHGNSDLVQTL